MSNKPQTKPMRQASLALVIMAMTVPATAELASQTTASDDANAVLQPLTSQNPNPDTNQTNLDNTAQTAQQGIAKGMPINLATYTAPLATDNTWIDRGRQKTKKVLSSTINHIDDWFGEPDANKPAKASIRVMVDTRWNRFDGTTVSPRIRAKVRLPTLENRLSVLVGDEILDDEPAGGGIHNDTRVGTQKVGEQAFDRQQAKENNASLALRWSKFRRSAGLDVDLGVRSDDVFLRFKAEKNWQLSHDIRARFEQMYRYGTRSEHTLLSTVEVSQPQSVNRTLVNRAHLLYTHRDDENLNWSNSLYQQHDWAARLGKKSLSYGLYTGGDVINKNPNLNIWGPYVSYRQPIWREWLFLQGDASFYNNKSSDRNHHLSLFSRVEMVF